MHFVLSIRSSNAAVKRPEEWTGGPFSDNLEEFAISLGDKSDINVKNIFGQVSANSDRSTNKGNMSVKVNDKWLDHGVTQHLEVSILFNFSIIISL